MKTLLIAFLLFLGCLSSFASECFIHVKNKDMLDTLTITNLTPNSKALEINVVEQVVKPNDMGTVRINATETGLEFELELKVGELDQVIKLKTTKESLSDKIGFVFTDDYGDHLEGDISQNTVYTKATIEI